MRFRHFFESRKSILAEALPFIEDILKDPSDETNLRVFTDWLQDSWDVQLNEMGKLLERLLNDDPWRGEPITTESFQFTNSLRKETTRQLNRFFGGIVLERDHIFHGRYGGEIHWKNHSLVAEHAGVHHVESRQAGIHTESVLDMIKNYPEMELPIVRWLVLQVLHAEDWLHKRGMIGVIDPKPQKISRPLRLILAVLDGAINKMYRNAQNLENVSEIVKIIEDLFVKVRQMGATHDNLLAIRNSLRIRLQSIFGNAAIDNESQLALLRLWNNYT